MKIVLVLAYFISMLFLTGCHFAGDPTANAASAHGFFHGMWDGAILFWSMIMTIFTKVELTEPYNSGFTYKLGFLIGALSFQWNIGLFLGAIAVLSYLLF